jgi:hypothetical protein
MTKILKWRVEGDNFVYTNEGYSSYRVENKNGVIKVTLFRDGDKSAEEYTLNSVSVSYFWE